MPDVMKDANLTDDQVVALIKSLTDRFFGKGVSGQQQQQIMNADSSFSGRVNWRRSHLHNLPMADPVMSDPWDDGAKYQSDLLRRTYTEMVSRLTENPVTFDISEPHEDDEETAYGDDFAVVLREGWLDIQERLQINIQEAISGGQVGEAFGLLHWRIDPEMMPQVPDYEEMAEEPNGKDTKRFKKDGDLWRETDKSLQDRVARLRAEAGFPIYIETPDIASYMWSEDRTLRGGDATACLMRKVGILDYDEADGSEPKGDDEALSIEELNPKVPIGEERDGVRSWMPSWVNYYENQEVTVYEFWTREEFYEAVDCGGGIDRPDGWVVRKSFKHPYGMPPFVRVPAVTYNVADPLLRYEPYMEGIYRIKPFADRQASLLGVMAEKSALPYFYWRNLKDGTPKLAEDGTSVIKFSQDSAAANIAPPGYELVKAEEVTINPAFVQLHVQLQQEMKDAAPPTGQAEVSATTQAFAIKFQQEQASVILRQALRNQVSGIKIMVGNWMKLMAMAAEDGGIGDTIYRWKSVTNQDGVRITDKSKAIGVDPKRIPGLTLDVNINATSQAEQTTKIQIGIQLVNDPNVPLTKIHVLKNYFGIEDPETAVAQFRAQTIFDSKIMPGLIDQQLAKTFGGQYVLAPDGQAVGYGGKSATPQDVLASNGYQPMQPPQQQMPPGGGGMGPPPGMGPAPAPPINIPPATMPQMPGMIPTAPVMG